MEKRPLRRLLARCVVLIAAVFLWTSHVFAAREASYEKVTQMYEGSDQSSQDSQGPISRPIVEYTSGTLRDPFQGVNTRPISSGQAQVQAKELPPMTIQGIMWGGKFNQAIINSKVVKAGDTIEGAQVISIEKNKIILIFEGRKFTLTVVGDAKTQNQAKKPAP